MDWRTSPTHYAMTDSGGGLWLGEGSSTHSHELSVIAPGVGLSLCRRAAGPALWARMFGLLWWTMVALLAVLLLFLCCFWAGPLRVGPNSL